MPDQPFTLARAETPADIAQIAALFRAYEADTGLDLCFQGFEKELATLPGKYAPPEGELLLARNHEGIAVGCAAFRPLEPGVCEFKRLYVDPSMRGKGLGRALTLAILSRAREVGYSQIKLDTLDSMRAAISLYQSLGFEDCQPYYGNRLEGVVYMSKDLL